MFVVTSSTDAKPDGKYSLDFALGLNQERAMMSQLLAKRSSGTIPPSLMRMGLSLRGKLDLGALQRALNEVVALHAGLRLTIFDNHRLDPHEREKRLAAFARTGIVQPGLHRLFLLQQAAVDIQQVNLAGRPRLQQEALIKARLKEEDLRPFDYHSAPLLRALLIKKGEYDHLLIVVVDHLVCDAWSLGVIEGEVSLLYRHFSRERSVPHSLPGSSFPDFVIWQNQALATSCFDSAVTYWRGQWARFGSARISVQDFPFASRQGPPGSFLFPSEYAQLDGSNAGEVRSFARRSKVTPFVIFLAAFAIVLSRYTKKRALAIWSHLANRTRPDTLGMIGWLSNSHILGIDLSSNPTGEDFLHQVNGVVLGALSHQELPLPHLWGVLQCAPRFSDAVVLMDFAALPKPVKTPGAGPSLRWERVMLPPLQTPRLSNFGIYVWDDTDCFLLMAKYSAAAFPPGAVRRLLSELGAVVSALADNPRSSVSQLADLVGESQSAGLSDAPPMNEFVVLDSALIPMFPVSGLREGDQPPW